MAEKIAVARIARTSPPVLSFAHGRLRPEHVEQMANPDSQPHREIQFDFRESRLLSFSPSGIFTTRQSSVFISNIPRTMVVPRSLETKRPLSRQADSGHLATMPQERGASSHSIENPEGRESPSAVSMAMPGQRVSRPLEIQVPAAHERYVPNLGQFANRVEGRSGNFTTSGEMPMRPEPIRETDVERSRAPSVAFQFGQTARSHPRPVATPENRLATERPMVSVSPTEKGFAQSLQTLTTRERFYPLREPRVPDSPLTESDVR